MGSGIAQTAAQNGLSTLLYDLRAEGLQQAERSIRSNLQQLVEKGKITAAAKEETLSRLVFIHQVTDCRADIIIEAIVEDAAVKNALFRQLAEINPPHTLLSSNTSSLSITRLQEQVPHPERFAGLHFFNPAQVMKLVEVVRGEHTSEATLAKLCELCRLLQKEPVICKDAPGFIVNRVARPYYIESLRLVEEGLADYSTIDKLMEATGFRMGPFRLMDLIGNDVNYAVSCSVYEQLGKPERLRPSYIQREMVEAGKLGRKTGEGYYRYES